MLRRLREVRREGDRTALAGRTGAQHQALSTSVLFEPHPTPPATPLHRRLNGAPTPFALRAAPPHSRALPMSHHLAHGPSPSATCSRGPPWPQVRLHNPERRHPSPTAEGEGPGMREHRPAHDHRPRHRPLAALITQHSALSTQHSALVSCPRQDRTCHIRCGAPPGLAAQPRASALRVRSLSNR